MKEDTKEIKLINNELFKKRLELARNKLSPPFEMKELQKVLKSLKSGKSKDPDNYVCELFKEGVIGNDLKESVLMLMNRIKEEISVPEGLRRANITILHKKGNKLDLNNWRGIFVSSVLRTILMKLIHDRTYEIVASHMTDAQIGARKNKSVRNHLFILNSIISDVMSAKNKDPIDLNIMDFKQMFDAEDIQTVLNSFYDSGIQDDLFALVYEANKSVDCAIKTPTGITDIKTIRNKIMQGDVLSPLISSNMVDQHIGKEAVISKNIYMYKNKVEIPPLMMQDDTLAVSVCGFETIKMNNFINTRSNIMGLQFGRDKCVQMHVGKKYSINICSNCKVSAWTENVLTSHEGKHYLQDTYIGEEVMKKVQEKKYLGDIISHNMKNTLNFKEKTNRAIGIVKKISTSIFERPYGRNTFRAALLMRESLLLGSMLSNSESWINISKLDLDLLEKPDVMVHRKILCDYGNPSKVFMFLELGTIPVKYVMMEKRLKFLRYILNESMTSMIRQVFEVQKLDSRKGDFCELIKKDLNDLNIEMNDEEIKSFSKSQWKKYVHTKTKSAAFDFLNEENKQKTRTKHIVFEDLNTREYLVENKSTTLSKIIFSARAGIIDLKSLNEWKYNDLNCVMCEKAVENFDHFMSCEAYGNNHMKVHWNKIFENDPEEQNEIAIEIQRRQHLRKRKEYEAGLPLQLAPLLQ